MQDVTWQDQDGCVRYLLGQMDEAAMAEFEECYFADDNLFEFLQAVEDDLIARRLRGDLSPLKLERFK